jgi:hypothetical protein
MNHWFTDIGISGGGGDGDGDDGDGDDGGGRSFPGFSKVFSKLFTRYPGLRQLANINKKAAGALAAFGGALMSPSSVSAAIPSVGPSDGTTVLDVLVAFGSNPLGFIWNLIVVRIIRLFVTGALWVASKVVAVILLIFAGDSLALETSGQLGLSDVLYAIVVRSFGAVATGVTLYFDIVTDLSRSLAPSTGTALDGAIATIVVAATMAVTAWLMYRLIIALLDSIPVLSGVQTFLSGGS